MPESHRIALFASPNSEDSIVGTELTERYCRDYVRLSGYVDVCFPPLSAESRETQLMRLESAKASVQQYSATQLARLNRQKLQLDVRRDQNAPVLPLLRGVES